MKGLGCSIQHFVKSLHPAKSTRIRPDMIHTLTGNNRRTVVRRMGGYTITSGMSGKRRQEIRRVQEVAEGAEKERRKAEATRRAQEAGKQADESEKLPGEGRRQQNLSTKYPGQRRKRNGKTKCEKCRTSPRESPMWSRRNKRERQRVQ